MSTPPTLQVAQVLADLSDLRVADPAAAVALLAAHKVPVESQPPSRSKTPSRSGTFSSLTSAEDKQSDGLTTTSKDVDVDLDRAKTLLRLFESRGQMQHTEYTTLMKSREKVQRATGQL